MALGVVDYVSRLVADVTKTLYARDSERWSESKIYFLVVWSMVTFGTVIGCTAFDNSGSGFNLTGSTATSCSGG